MSRGPILDKSAEESYLVGYLCWLVIFTAFALPILAFSYGLNALGDLLLR